jgi:cytochrome P450
MAVTNNGKLRYNLFTFGFGSRKCLGQRFAEIMIKQFVCQLLNDYEIRLPETNRGNDLDQNSTRDTWVPISDLRVTLTQIRQTR